MDRDDRYVVVWDLETQDVIKNSIGTTERDRIRNLEVSCLSALKIPSAGLLNWETAQQAVEDAPMRTWWRDVDEEGVGPFAEFLALCDGAEVVAGYNSLHFDHPVMLKHCKKRRYEEHVVKSVDPFARIRDVTDVWFKLDALLKANGLATKTASGLQAIEFWNDGDRDKLQTYCEQDVRASARLFALRELTLPNGVTKLPNYLFGLQSAIAARRMSDTAVKRAALEDDPTGDARVETASSGAGESTC